ncbi:MerR family transcriptional regulator [Brevibacterium sp. HMSC07C04]|uniref:MerR family transcriptional regulator n=1 Tax=Brevibacterium sp. HMSC07C04 TaxID=1581130 RepID=UPI0008A4B412|nr:MerR family transcriptional regulator [Brevibacterium sp. HMSC07C04]OFS24573.1 MerR family transcriptional regulator [Brevibacterium sp. HMSC07C04]
MNSEEEHFSVGEVARQFGITVRTLHHWEELGLVSPSARSRSNYRIYTRADLETIQQIMIYRATGMRLTAVKDVLNSGTDHIAHLRRQREILTSQMQQTEEMLRAIDRLIAKETSTVKPSLNEIGEILGEARFAEHHAQAEETYGDTDDWSISQQRTAAWSHDDWAANKSRFDAVEAKLAEAVRRNVSVCSAEAADLAAQHREVLSEFFPVTPAKHYLISRSYIADEDFAKHYEDRQPGLARWLADAIEAAAKTHGVNLDSPQWE